MKNNRKGDIYSRPQAHIKYFVEKNKLSSTGHLYFSEIF